MDTSILKSIHMEALTFFDELRVCPDKWDLKEIMLEKILIRALPGTQEAWGQEIEKYLDSLNNSAS